MNWLLTALRLLIETFPVTKLVLIAASHYTRIFNFWVKVY